MKPNNDRPLSAAETEKLEAHGVGYPWKPRNLLRLIDEAESREAVLRNLIEGWKTSVTLSTGAMRASFVLCIAEIEAILDPGE